ncbi:hypothetical protein EDB85DRAFT_1943563 [Lactarius pseudohatsudake]|nr:hypothetical protein EDB85DRAFT_1943563 [Lactarius pseudohatsudake]
MFSRWLLTFQVLDLLPLALDVLPVLHSRDSNHIFVICSFHDLTFWYQSGRDIIRPLPSVAWGYVNISVMHRRIMHRRIQIIFGTSTIGGVYLFFLDQGEYAIVPKAKW